MKLLPVGTRVIHFKHDHLRGKIACHEYHEGGGISPLPYKVYWDDNKEAARLLGFMFLYPPQGAVSEECKGRV